jgi:hypothetical protein
MIISEVSRMSGGSAVFSDTTDGSAYQHWLDRTAVRRRDALRMDQCMRQVASSGKCLTWLGGSASMSPNLAYPSLAVGAEVLSV